MKRNLFIFIIYLLFAVLPCSAANLDQALNTIIKENPLSQEAIVSVSIREAYSEKVIYEKDSQLLLHPASTLKTFTTYAVLKILGQGHKLSTSLFFDNYGNVYLKLGADPMLTSKDLRDLFVKVKGAGLKDIKGSFIIDDNIIDKKIMGVGWMWDDELSPYMPKFSAYNLDHNIIKARVLPTKRNFTPKLVINSRYPIDIVNEAYTSNINDLKLNKRPWESCNRYYLSGPIASTYSLKLPVTNPKNYFMFQLESSLSYSGIAVNKGIKTGMVPQNASLIATINNSLLEALSHTNKQSDNMYAESLFKIAGGWYNRGKGTTEDAYKAFNDIYTAMGVDPSHLELVDGSGVSHNNLITTDWMTLALSRINKQPDGEIFKTTLPRPGEKGTMKLRLLELNSNVWAKTGSLANASGITGYLKAQSGKIYCYAILIQNFKGKSIRAKYLEDQIIKQLNYY